MLHIDLPSDEDLRWLASLTIDPTISIYLPTTPVTPDAQADRIAFRNLYRDALDAIRATGLRKPHIDAIEEQLDDLVDDDDFWAHQANGLAVFATERGMRTYRLPDSVAPSMHVGTQPFLKPLIEVAKSPRAYLVLALSADDARLLEVTGDGLVERVRVEGMPTSASDHARKASINDRSHSGRLVGDEGKAVHLRAYVRAVDAAVRPLLHGQAEPLVLVATDPLAQMFRSVSTYPHLLDEGVSLSADHEKDAAVAAHAAPVVAKHYADEDTALLDLLKERQNTGRSALEAQGISRAAVQGAIDTLLIDTSVDIAGDIAEDGTIVASDRIGGVTEALTRLVLAGGGTVRHVDAALLPADTPAAAILRWAV